jgi:hypothetical protein
MTRRSVRITLFCFGVLLTAALSYRVLADERTLSSERQQLSFIDSSIDDVLRTLADVRGALHAYVAPGQRASVWETRSAALFDKLRQQLIALDATADSTGRSLNDSLDNLDQLTAAEKRVQHYLDFSQPLLAGDVIFTEIRDLVDATGAQVNSVRDALHQDANGRIEKVRLEQATLVASGTALWVTLAALLAFLPVRARDQVAASEASGKASGSEIFDLSLAPQVLPQTVATAPEPEAPHMPDVTVPPVVEVAELPMPEESPEALQWKSVAVICRELAAVKDLSLLSPTLSRACEALGAKDAILWVASTDGATLSPQASHGLDPRVLARIGAIPKDAANLTAAAFRDGRPRQTGASTSAPGALTVALKGPSGPVGVFSAELQPETDPAEAIDLATLFAAQVTPLVLQSQAAATEIPQLRQA